jgi:hypothetical protein
VKKKTIFPLIVDRVPQCPACGRRNDRIAGNAVPQKGDWNICYGCCAVLRFVSDETLESRLATPEELEQAISAGELESDDAEMLRSCFAERARRRGPPT